MRINYFLIVLLLLLLSACNNNKIDKFYYDSGELCSETYWIDKEKKMYHYTDYYKNGVIESEGTALEDGRIDGERKEYYSDGVLKWAGFAQEGHIVIAESKEKMSDFIQQPRQLQIEKRQGEPLKVGTTYKISTIIEGVHPSIYNVLVNGPNDIRVNEEDPDRFPFVITPKEAGEIYIMLVFPNKDGYLIVGNEDSSLSFVCEVVE